MKTEAEVRAQVENEFSALDAAAGPGVMMLLEVYGDVANAYRQAEQYLSAASPAPNVLTTNTSL